MFFVFLTFVFLGLYSQFKDTPSLNQEDVYTKFVDSEGYEWYGTRDGLKRYDGYTYETFRSDRHNPELLRSNDIMCISEDRLNHDVWFGTKNGCYILDKESYTIKEAHIYSSVPSMELDSMELMDKRINSILCSKDGHIWISYRNQILELDKNHTLLRRHETQWNGRNRSSIQLLEDESSCIWTNLWNGGICRKPKDADDFIPCTWSDASYPSEIRIDHFNGSVIAITPEGNTYHYSSGGTLMGSPSPPTTKASDPFQFVGKDEKARLESLLNERMLCCTKDSDSHIYIGTFDNIYRYDVENSKAEQMASNTGRIHDICIDNGTVYFISNAKGLCKIVNGSVVQLAEGSNFSSLSIDGNRAIWLSNRMGNVFKTHDGANVVLSDDSIAGNLNGDAVIVVRSDGKNRLWILSRNTLKEFNTENGGCKILNSKELAVGSFKMLYVEDGGIYLEGTDSVLHLRNTVALSSQNEIKRIALSSYTINGSHVLCPYNTDVLNIDSSTDNIIFFLTCFIFDNTDHIIYSYRIDDSDYHELDLGVNSFNLSSIPYGTHNIFVKGRDSYGRWSKDFNVLTFVHPRPWYHYALLSVIIAGLGLFIIWYLIRLRRFRRKVSARIKRYEQEKELLEEKLREAESNARKMGYKEADSSADYPSLSNTDKEFIEQCRKLVEKNLSNIEYGVDALSGDLYMSRMNLYRKVREITGKSPTDFIRDIRLERAVMLLKTTNYSINEVSDLVGFSYPSYFTKCFKDKYGKTPKEELSLRLNEK